MLHPALVVLVLLILAGAGVFVSGSVAAVSAVLIRFTELRPIPVVLLASAIVGVGVAALVVLA